METAATAGPVRPEVPQNIADLGIPQSMVADLVLRWLREHGSGTLSGLRKGLRLAYPIVEATFQELRQQQLVEVKGLAGTDFTFTLTTRGRALAGERAAICRYAGPAPVPLAQYSAMVRSQAARVHIDREILGKALSDLVLTDSMLDLLGPALVSQKSLFLYGPTGNGKTSIAERLLRIYSDTVLVPYAVEVDGQIVSVYDPILHRAAEPEAADAPFDPRWVVCRRPCVMVGSELAPWMVELRFDETTGVYVAPLQMKANNGMFVIDDFGRQAMDHRALLNRWIVPLDRRVDYLSLRYGVTFQIPFELMVVFSTNLEPDDLGDEAFIRRMNNKIYVEPVDPDTFDLIFERVLSERGIPCEPGMAAQFRSICHGHGVTRLRACYPADICNILAWTAEYRGRPLIINKESLSHAAELYFTRAHKRGAY